MSTPPIGIQQNSPVIPGDMRAAPQAAEPPAPPPTPAHMRADAVTRQDASIAALGTAAADRMINEKKWKLLETYVADSNSDTERTVHVSMNVLLGVGLRFAGILAYGEANGTFKISGEIPTGNDLIYEFTLGRGRFLPALNRVVTAMQKVCVAVPGLRVSDPAPVEESAPEPQKIEIVGMPSRTTSSAVTRDSDGNITSTTQVERDA